MKQNIIPVSGPVTVVVDQIAGDLQVAGWDRLEVSVKTDGDDATLRVDDDQVYASAPGDLILYLPREANLQIGDVSGDVDIRAVSGDIRMESIGGDLQMRAIGPALLKTVGGDLSVRSCSGDFTAERVGSDALLRDLQGNLKIATVGGDLCLRNLSGSIDALAGADAILYLRPAPTAKIHIQAGSDILLHLPAQLDAELSLQGGSIESVRVDFMGIAPGRIGPVQTVKIGSGAAKIRLAGGGDVIVTGPTDSGEGQPQVEFGSGGTDFSHFYDQFAQRVQEATQNAQRHRERAEQRVEAAMRRAEEKMRASERRANFVGVAVGRGAVGRPPSPVAPPPAPVNEPVSDGERLVVLQMLQNKKISLAEAEKLLSALEGK